MTDKKKRFLFIVQGEGRGHMMQAIALQDILLNAGHEICAVLVGKSERREIPGFFYEKMKAPLTSYLSPNFVLKSDRKSLDIPKTIFYNFRKSKSFFKSLAFLHQQVKLHQPDVIVNFYELLTGMYYFLYRPKVKHIVLSHHFFLQHNDFPGLEKRNPEMILLGMNSYITSIGACKKLALSFAETHNLPEKKIYVVPPLLRKEVFSFEVKVEDFILVYLLNDGYAYEIIEWHKKNPNVKLHCFWDKKGVDEIVEFSENLIFHKLNDKKFLEMMSRCRGYVSTAGFESICEAMYFGKPVMIVPVNGHVEQECNAVDAVRVGAGITSAEFNLDPFMQYLPTHKTNTEVFRNWASQAEERFLKELEK